MAEVTAFTAERSKAIEDNAIVSGLVVGDDLILYRNNGQNEINAGSVRGPQGDQGPMGITDIPTGSLQQFAGQTAPMGWLFCQGQAINREEYEFLFGVIGVIYGAGDGTTTFNLPDFRNRVPVGTGPTKPHGSTGGAETHTLTIQQIPSHAHNMNHSHSITGGFIAGQSGSGLGLVASGFGVINRATTNGHNGNTLSNGGSQAHNNMQPYLSVHYMIKT